MSDVFAAQPTTEPYRFTKMVEQRHCVAVRDRFYMMGGVGFGLAISAMQQATGRPLIWATAQFIAQAGAGDRLEIAVREEMAGRNVTQAQASMLGPDGPVLHVMGALGGREGFQDAYFRPMPDVPGPREMPEWRENQDVRDELRGQFERRYVILPEQGRAHMWMRSTSGEPMSAAYLAVLADYLAGGHPRTHNAASLDNTLRLFELVPTEWVFCDTQISGYARGAFRGHMHLYAEDGTLMATAEQSGNLARR